MSPPPPNTGVEDGWETLHLPLRRHASPCSTSRVTTAYISVWIISFGCGGRCVSKICIISIFIASLASKIFSDCCLSPPLTFQKCEHLEPSCTFPFVFQQTSLKFPSSHGAAGHCDLIVCCNHVKGLQQKRADAFVFERFGFQSPRLQFGPNNDLMLVCVLRLIIEIKVWLRKTHHPSSTSLYRVFRWVFLIGTNLRTRDRRLNFCLYYIWSSTWNRWIRLLSCDLHFQLTSFTFCLLATLLQVTDRRYATLPMRASVTSILAGCWEERAARHRTHARRKQIAEIFHTVDGWRVVRLSCCLVASLRNHQGVRTINPLTVLADGVPARGLTINNQADHLNKPSLSDRWHKGYINGNEQPSIFWAAPPCSGGIFRPSSPFVVC